MLTSVSQMLQKFREGQEKVEQKEDVTKIRHMFLEILSKEKITFGKAKVGQMFPEVFQDAKWRDWFIRTYENSAKPDHQKFVST